MGRRARISPLRGLHFSGPLCSHLRKTVSRERANLAGHIPPPPSITSSGTWHTNTPDTFAGAEMIFLAPRWAAKSSWEESTTTVQGAVRERAERTPGSSAAGSKADRKQGLAVQGWAQSEGLRERRGAGKGGEARKPPSPGIPRCQRRGAPVLWCVSGRAQGQIRQPGEALALLKDSV